MAGYTAAEIQAAYQRGEHPGVISSMLANGGEWTAARVQETFGFDAARLAGFRNEGILFADDYVSGAAPGVTPITDAQVQGWLGANQGATDRQVAAAMDQYGVGVEQMARAAGLSRDEVQRRYNGAVGPAAIAGTNAPPNAPAPVAPPPSVLPPQPRAAVSPLLVLVAAAAAAAMVLL